MAATRHAGGRAPQSRRRLPAAMADAEPVDPAAVRPRGQRHTRDRATEAPVAVPAAHRSPLARPVAAMDFLDCALGACRLNRTRGQCLGRTCQHRRHGHSRKRQDRSVRHRAHPLLGFPDSGGVTGAIEHSRRDPMVCGPACVRHRCRGSISRACFCRCARSARSDGDAESRVRRG